MCVVWPGTWTVAGSRNKLCNMTNTHRLDKIVIVDDDARIRDLLRRFLSQEGFDVLMAEDSRALTRIMQRESVDLLVLDLMLPGEDGLTICRRLREEGQKVPIVMLTAKGEDVDRIAGLEIGADDYLATPFNPRELLARIHAVLRRQAALPPGAPEADEPAIRFGNVEVDLAARSIKRGDELLNLTTGDFAVLKVLLQHPRQPLSRDKLMALARGREQGPFDRAIDVQVSRLRKLIETNPANARYLQTVWGVGYVFVPDAGA